MTLYVLLVSINMKVLIFQIWIIIVQQMLISMKTKLKPDFYDGSRTGIKSRGGKRNHFHSKTFCSWAKSQGSSATNGEIKSNLHYSELLISTINKL